LGRVGLGEARATGARRAPVAQARTTTPSLPSAAGPAAGQVNTQVRQSLQGQVEHPMEDIDQKVIEIVSEQMGVDKSEITRDTHFINDLNADSLDTVELVMEFEDEFELSIPDEEAEKIQTVGQAIDYIKGHQNKQ
jgi:acyl carrier protein